MKNHWIAGRAAPLFLALTAPAVVLVSLHAQSLTPGELLVSRSTYEGVASTVSVGQALPGGGVAVADGSNLSVFNNENPDAAFGITSSILIDQFNTSTNSVNSTIDITALAKSQGVDFTTSFPSKSELALTPSTNGTSISFMGYVAPKNTLDVSNSNTATVLDPTNPVTSTYSRGIGTLSLDGTLSVTPVNAYSGNNGRGAVLVNGSTPTNGNYFTVGNAGNSGGTAKLTTQVTLGSNTLTLTGAKLGTNGTDNITVGQAVSGAGIAAGTTITSVVDASHVTISTTASATASESVTYGTNPSGNLLSQLSDNTGVQTIAQGSSGATQVVGVVNGTFGSTTGYQRGFSSLSTDKTGKDDNFRGLTVFNNTLYVTKGSGSNGVNTVYQVGANGSLTSLASTAGSAPISILNGFNTVNEKTTPSGLAPFGLFFANASTLYVADEGNGVAGDAFAGLQKWVNSKADGSGVWTRAYTLQNGLGLDQSYTVGGTLKNGIAGSITTLTGGLRNLTGVVNGDSVTFYAVTSTYNSSVKDSGADPNKLVEITDSLSSLTGTGESFTTLETAAYGDVLRGVTLAPVPEPATYALLAGLGAFGAVLISRRRKQR